MRKAKPAEVNGKVALRLPKSLHRRAVLYAAREGVSLNQFLMTLVAEHVGRAIAAEDAPEAPTGGGKR